MPEDDVWGKETQTQQKPSQNKKGFKCRVDLWYSRNSGRKPCEIHAPAKNLGCLLRVLSSASPKELKVLPLFTHCFCCRPGCESGAPLTQFTLAGCECLLRATGCGQACPGLFCTASPYSLEAGMDEWPSLGKYYHLPENAGSELYPKEARQHSGENLISSWVKLPRLYTWREAETSAFEKVTWEHSLTS